ncbi:MAG TPA: citrate/2-methylcitrate synthase [Candidatus Bathyarchaeia archaeon]|nr:citrate/2-methylcitrate synthase [Candidatus Bathyarchaeia archaeon]
MQVNAVQRMLDFDYVSKREKPSVAALIDPTGSDGYQKFFFGTREIIIPIYKSVNVAAAQHPNVDVLINFASFRSAAQSTEEALAIPSIRTHVIIAEGIPERRTRLLTDKARKLGKVIIGPATVGGIVAGAFKIGNTGGTIENIVESKLHIPGSVGFVSKSGGLSNEVYNIIARNSDGLYEGIAIGGDSYPGTSLLDHLQRFEQNPKIKMLVCLGEVGGTDEYAIVEALKKKQITKPLVIWVTGTCAKAFKTDVQFGHAGARAKSDTETAHAKNTALRDAGALVPYSFDEYDEAINRVYKKLVEQGVILPRPAPQVPRMPIDYAAALKQGLVRKPTNFISTISDDRGEELLYSNMTISDVFANDIGIGGVLSLLWFKKLLSRNTIKFIEMAIMITADHGPAVSGAHNTIVAARAGKDLISSIVSGMLTIGPRFGGALDGAAQQFSNALDTGLTPKQFVDQMKSRGTLIQGIGHRIKSIHNPDMRVTIMKDYVKSHFKATPLLDYALEVEKITTSKRDNLILNVDGCIGICFADLLRIELGNELADEYIKMGALNGLFVLGRSIGLMGHYLDQNRLKQPLYRHPWDDITYMS